MFPPPIRPIQSSEVRRVDEVTARKSIVERVPSPLSQSPDEAVRLTIGAAARRLAGGQDEPLMAGEEPDSTSELVLGEEEQPSRSGGVDGAAFRQAFASAERRGVTVPAVESEDSEATTFANRALRAFSSGETAAGSAGPADDEDGEVAWTAEDSAKVPFEVLQRAVTQATAQGESDEPHGEMVSYSPNEPIFSPPENGGEPFGRAVPFEVEPSEEDAGAAPFSPFSQPNAELVGDSFGSSSAEEASGDTRSFVP